MPRGEWRLRRELETLLREAKHAELIARAEQELSETSLSPVEAAWTCIYACRAAGALGAWGQAVVWAERGLGCRSRDIEVEGRLKFLLGTALMYTGDLLRSERMLSEFLTAADRAPSLQALKPDGLFNRALSLQFQQRTADVVADFRRAAAEYASRGRLARVLICRVELAWCLLLDGKVDEAQSEMATVETALETEGDAETAVVVALALALHHRLMGDLDGSDRVCESLLAGSDLLPRQLADLFWIHGCNARDRGDADLAEDYADRAREQAVKEWWPLQLSRIQALGQDLRTQTGTGR